MKKLTWLFFSCCLYLSALSQWTTSGSNIYNSNSGNVGIGTTSPSYLLHVTGSGNDQIGVIATGSGRGGYYVQNTNSAGHADLIIENDHGSFGSYGVFAIGCSSNSYSTIFGLSRADRTYIISDGASNLGLMLGTLPAQPLIFGTYNTERMRVFGGGNVAIGTTSDNGNLLQVNGHLWATGLVLPTGAASGKVLTSDGSGNATWQTAGSSSGWVFGGNTVGAVKILGTVDNYDLPVITNNVERLRVTAGGSLAIGTTNPQGYLLAVNGSAIFTAAWVKPYSGWPDYVFEHGYRLPSLDSIANYIRAYHHLPDIPSAENVQAKGIDLGATQAVLLKKIEELTLYLIDQKKAIEELREQNAQLKAQQERLDRLEQLVEHLSKKGASSALNTQP